MDDCRFDVLIPVAQKDTRFVKTVISKINTYINGCCNIYVITNKKNYNRLKDVSKISNVQLLDENNLVPELSFDIVRRNMIRKGKKKLGGVGWYFQQLLKYGFAKTKYANKYYLTWDADTLPLTKLSFFDGAIPLFTKKIEYHEPYFDTMKRIFGFGKLVDYSFIAEHMIFNSSIVKEMLNSIESNKILEGTTWVEKIIMACDFSDKRGNLFSEFETYGNYCHKFYPEMYGIRQLNTFRAAGLIRGRHINKHILERLSMDFNIVSFEEQDSPFPYNIPWYWRRVRDKLKFTIKNITFFNIQNKNDK